MQVKKKQVKLQIWDTAGQEEFKSLTRSYYRSSVGVLIVFDYSKKESLDHVEDWIKEFNKTADINESVVILVGNKTDLLDQGK